MAKKGTKKLERETKKQRKSSRKKSKFLIWVLAAVVVAGAGWWFVQKDQNLPGQQLENQGRSHFPDGTPSPIYNSSPPTSGPHASPARWGESNRDIPHINQVHNLEHGGILIQYNCDRRPKGSSCFENVERLREALLRARNEIDKKILLAPYGKMERFIAVTSWTWIQYFDRVDEEGILKFADAHINRAPERVE